MTYRENLSAPAVIIFDEQESVRAETSGFVEQILVNNGDKVDTGQLLVVPTNDELKTKIKNLDLQLEISKLRKRQTGARGEYAASQVLVEQIEVLDTKHASLQADQESLKLIAPVTGTVIGDIRNRIGTYIYKGEELCQIIRPDNKHLVASVSQNDISALHGVPDKPVTVDMKTSGVGTFDSTIDEISPTASTELNHFSFAAKFRGPLDVKISTTNSDNAGYEYFLPRFSVKLELPEKQQLLTRNGQQTLIFFRGIDLPPAIHFWQRIKRWYDNKLNPEVPSV